jgi:uncharacterized protein (TIGR00255 family)
MAERGGHRVVVEMRSVNHRYLDLKTRGVSVGPALEAQIVKLVKGRLGRGSVVLSVRVKSQAASAPIRVDVAAARRALSELRRLDELDLDGGISPQLLCAQPGVLVQGEDEDQDESTELAECTTEAARSCLDALVAMREAEGAALRVDIESRLDHLVELARRVAELVASAPGEAQKRLSERLDKLLSNVDVEVDSDRLAHEVALLADRLDVTEELVRLESHVGQARKLLATSDKPIGRRLDFLVQELGREVNTITSKSQSAEIAALVVEAKAELEKVREQVQNVE